MHARWLMIPLTIAAGALGAGCATPDATRSEPIASARSECKVVSVYSASDVIHNQKFRIGLSHAINRKEIIDTVFFGKGEPWQAAPRKESPFFHERLVGDTEVAARLKEFDVIVAMRERTELTRQVIEQAAQ